MQSVRQPHPSRHGFTLLELLVVIAMMIFIATIALVNYFGATRSSSYSAGDKNILSALQLTRQRACIDGTPTFLTLIDATNYTIVRAGGSIVNIQPDAGFGYTFYDIYSDLSGLPNAGTIVDMDWDTSADIRLVQPGQSQTNMPWHYDQSAYEIHVTNCVGSTARGFGGWQVGDRYGFRLHAVQTVPKGFYLALGNGDGHTAPMRQNIMFQPDGSATWDPTLDVGGACKFSLIEKLKENDTANRIVFVVDSSGKINSGAY